VSVWAIEIGLTLDGEPELGGDQTANFEKAEPFKFLAPSLK
jgi:hypothetical protein